MVGFEAFVSYPTIHNSLHTWIISFEGNVDCAIFFGTYHTSTIISSVFEMCVCWDQ